ncbi:MAG TPA: hypothetical protein VMP01_03420 [Pirellulaceae bacterium]|nr:hypothetical protein [Pirellulaceae bacterium]
MRILLDECVPRPLIRELVMHDAHTVPDMGWSGMRNGQLLAAMAAAGFEVFLTVDQNLQFQQNLAVSPLSTIVICAVSNRLADLLPLMPRVHAVLASIRPGQHIEVR